MGNTAQPRRGRRILVVAWLLIAVIGALPLLAQPTNTPHFVPESARAS